MTVEKSLSGFEREYTAVDVGPFCVIWASVGPPVGTAGLIADDADCVVRGSAQNLYLALWNRPGKEHLTVTGHSELLDLFEWQIKMRW